MELNSPTASRDHAAIGPVARAAWGVTVGDRVALEPHLACGRCPACLGGSYHLCKTLLAVAAWGILAHQPRLPDAGPAPAMAQPARATAAPATSASAVPSATRPVANPSP